MQAFKAANPKAVLADFVRWQSLTHGPLQPAQIEVLPPPVLPFPLLGSPLHSTEPASAVEVGVGHLKDIDFSSSLLISPHRLPEGPAP